MSWLGTPPEPSQYHDPAMLRLFFTDAAPERALTLAKQRIGECTGMPQFLEQRLGVARNPRRAARAGRGVLGQLTAAMLTEWVDLEAARTRRH